MAIGTIGRDITPAGVSPNNYTMIAIKDPATAKGVIKQVVIEVGDQNAPHNVAIKLIRTVGANYVVIYNQYLTSLNVDGENTVTLVTPFNVEIGDMLAYWTGISGSIALLSHQSSTGTNYASVVNVDLTTQIAIASCGTGSEIIGLRANIEALPAGGGILNWFFSQAWKKHDKLWTPKLILPKEGFSY